MDTWLIVLLFLCTAPLWLPYLFVIVVAIVVFTATGIVILADAITSWRRR